MQDIAGCRLVVRDIREQDQVVGALKGALPASVVVDRREKPSFGYRAVHVVVMARGKQIEIQVRTELQHLWAELSERSSDVSGAAVKYGEGDPDILAQLSRSSEAIDNIEALELRAGTAGGIELLSRGRRNARRILIAGIRMLAGLRGPEDRE